MAWGIDRPSGDSRRLIRSSLPRRSEPPAYPISDPTVVARAENLNKHRQSLTHAAYSKTVSGGFPLTRVRIPPPPLFEPFSTHLQAIRLIGRRTLRRRGNR